MHKYVIIIIALCLPLSGCTIKRQKTVPLEPLKYYRYQACDLGNLGSVLMLEINNLSQNRLISEDITGVLAEEIRKQQVFGLKTISQLDPNWKNLQIPVAKDFSKIQLELIRTTLNADAILYGAVTHYRPYPKNLIGLDLKLVDCSTGRILWAVDDVWDITYLATQKRAKAFYENQVHDNYGPLESEIVTLSPGMFNKFIAHEISRTLKNDSTVDNNLLSSAGNSALLQKGKF